MQSIRFPDAPISLYDFNQDISSYVRQNVIEKIANLTGSLIPEKISEQTSWSYSLKKAEKICSFRRISTLVCVSGGVTFLVSALVTYLLFTYWPHLLTTGSVPAPLACIALTLAGSSSLVIWIASVSICQYLLKKKRQPEEIKNIISKEKIFLEKDKAKAQTKYEALTKANLAVKSILVSPTFVEKSAEKLELAKYLMDLYNATLAILNEM